MEDIRRADRAIWIRELTAAGRLAGSGLALLFLLPITLINGPPMEIRIVFSLLSAAVLGIHMNSAFRKSIEKRFLNRRFESLWTACKDRHSRYEEVLAKMRKEQVADLQEMPKTIRHVAESLYVVLRRADIISHEVMLTEKGIYTQPSSWNAPAYDAQAKQLYQIADRNIAEYRQQFSGVMAGVQRAEAQAAVFMTTLDTLRMKMIGYRLVGKSPELSNDEFLSSLHEAKLQLLAIDQALEELDFISVPPGFEMPPPMPDDAAQQQQRFPT